MQETTISSSGSASRLHSAGTLRMAQTGFTGSGVGWGNGRAVEVASSATLEAAANFNGGATRQVTLNGGTLSLTAGSTTDSLNYVNNLTMNDGASVTGNSLRMGYYAQGLVTVGGTAASTFDTGIVLANSGSSTVTFDVADATGSSDADLTVSGVIRDLGSAYDDAPIIKNGSGTLVFSGSNTYTGQTTVNAGTLVAGVGTSYGGGSGPAFGTGDVVVNAGAMITGSTSFSVGGGDDTTRRVTLNGGTWDASYASAGAEYVRYLDMTAGSLTVSAAQYIRTPYGGGLEVTTFAADTSSRITAGIALTRGNLSLNVADGAAAEDLVLSGSLLPYSTNNPQAVIKSGAGTAVLTGTGTYTGGTSVNDGVLQIGTALTSGGGVLPTTGDTAIAAGATLRFAHGVTGPEYAGTLSGSGTLEVVGTGGTSNDLRLSGDNSSFTGSVEIAGGHLRAANAAALSAANAVTISDSGVLSVFAYGAGNQYDITIGSLASADATALVRLDCQWGLPRSGRRRDGGELDEPCGRSDLPAEFRRQHGGRHCGRLSRQRRVALAGDLMDRRHARHDLFGRTLADQHLGRRPGALDDFRPDGAGPSRLRS